MGRTSRIALTARAAFALVSIVSIVPTFLHGAEKGQVLVEKYGAAHEARYVEALKALVYWEGSSKRTREIIEQRLVRHLNLEIKRIEFRPLSGDEEFDNRGYRPNLKPVGWLAIFFKPPKGDSRFFSKSFVVGEKDGGYIITVAEPAHRPVRR
jgi:hypothetical protein